MLKTRLGEEIDVDKIPQSGLDRYTHAELYQIARIAMQKLDIQLLKVRWQLIDSSTKKQELIQIIKRINNCGTKA